ncbi:hypothetical protein [Escherichia coli]|uniref:hypothetical protein n=1 Tax=Escherichia coli TaxID=562 RepID=UPI00038F76A7|nr:hypothetical protein [Escherichia coli]EQR62639.1 hypothetical protein G788_00861 [Escherichia coli HVH 128 (4-7030436)]
MAYPEERQSNNKEKEKKPEKKAGQIHQRRCKQEKHDTQPQGKDRRNGKDELPKRPESPKPTRKQQTEPAETKKQK